MHRITIEHTLKEAASRAIHEENLFRKNQAAKRLQYYQDNQEGELILLLREQFVDPSIMLKQLTWHNIVKPIIDKTSLVYQDPPKRVVTVGDEPNEKGQEVWDAIQEATDMDVALKTVNRLTTLLKRVILKVAFRHDQIALDIITPNILDIIVDEDVDPIRPVAMFWAMNSAHAIQVERTSGNGNGPLDPVNSILAGANPSEIKFEFWSTDDHPDFPGKHFIFSGDGVIIPNPDNPQNLNPYKVDGKTILPVVEFGDSYPIDTWFLQGGNDLIQAQDTINVTMTHLQNLIKMQSFGIPVASGVDLKAEIVIDPSRVIKIPPPSPGEPMGTFEFQAPGAKMIEVQQIIEDRIRDIATAHNLAPASFQLSGQVASGLSLKIQNTGLMEARQDSIQLYRAYERDLYQTIKVVNNEHVTGERLLPKESSITTDFAELDFPETAEEELNALEKGVKLGVDSSIDFMRRKNPDLSQEEAEKKFMKNKAEGRATSARIEPRRIADRLVPDSAGELEVDDGEV